MAREEARLGRIRRAGALALAVAILVPLAGCGRLGARMKLKAGNRAYKDSRWADALAAYDKVPADVPERLMAQLGTAYTWMAQYRFGSRLEKDKKAADEAIKAYEAYLQIRPRDLKDETYPDHDKVEDWILTLLIDRERYADAVERLNRQLQQKPNDAAILRGLASAHEKWGKPVSAIQWYEKWAKTFPTDAAPHVAIAAFCWNVSFRKAAGLDPLERNRWIDHGLASAEAALKIDPNHFEGLTYKNLLLRERAKMRVDPDAVADLVTQATEIHARVTEMRKKQKEAEEAAKAKAVSSPAPAAPGGAS